MYRIGKQFRFEAAHSLPGLAPGHKCARPHGHSYTIEVALVADELEGTGFVTDFADLAAVQTYLDDVLDHRDLNGVLDMPATSENLARHLYQWCTSNLTLPGGVSVAAVRVSETSTTFAEYTPSRS